MSSRQLAEELLLKFKIKTSKSVICRTLKSKDDIMSLKMENDASKKRKHMLSKERYEFEKLLDSRLRKNFLKKKVRKKTWKIFKIYLIYLVKFIQPDHKCKFGVKSLTFLALINRNKKSTIFDFFQFCPLLVPSKFFWKKCFVPY